MRNHTASSFSKEELYQAYRKAKVDLFYTGYPYRLKIVKFEKKLKENIEALHKLLNNYSQDSSKWETKFKKYCNGYIYYPKSYKVEIPDSNRFIYSTYQNEAFDEQGSKGELRFRVAALLPIEFHIVTTLWIKYVGDALDKQLGDNVYGNRLRRPEIPKMAETDNDDDLPSFSWHSLGCFERYLQKYQQWRDNAVRIARKELEEHKNIDIITGDLKGFYDNVDVEQVLCKKYLEKHNVVLNSGEKGEILNKLVVFMLKQWKESSPLKRGLPIGCSISSVIANAALLDFDAEIEAQVKPLYYGRYVDDLLLVLQHSKEWKTTQDIFNWLADRMKLLCKPPMPKVSDKQADTDTAQANQTALYQIIYGQSAISSTDEEKAIVELNPEKVKVFCLDAKNGHRAIEVFCSQLEQLSSEWRLMPEIPALKSIAAKFFMAGSNDGEEADSLRKIDALSVRRAKFALRVRDFEAMCRNLEFDTWEKERQELLQTYVWSYQDYTFFFDYFKFLPRIITIAVHCNEVAYLQQLMRTVKNCFSVIRKNLKYIDLQLSSKSKQTTEEQAPKNTAVQLQKEKLQLLEQCEKDIEFIIIDAVLGSCARSLCISNNSREEQKRFEAWIKIGKAIRLCAAQEKLQEENCIKQWLGQDKDNNPKQTRQDIANYASRIFLADLSFYPQRFLYLAGRYGIYPNLLHCIDFKKTVKALSGQFSTALRHSTPAIVLQPESLCCLFSSLLRHVRNTEPECKGEAPGAVNKNEIPLSWLFPTRPFDELELNVLVDDEKMPDGTQIDRSCLIRNVLIALRGYPKKMTPEAQEAENFLDGELLSDIVSQSDNLEGETKSIRVALTNWNMQEKEWKNSACDKAILDFKRYSRLCSLVNSILASPRKIDYIVFPELALPVDWFIPLANKLAKNRVSLIAGLEYIHHGNNEVSNEVWCSLVKKGDPFNRVQIFKHSKSQPALDEQRELNKVANKTFKSCCVSLENILCKHGNFRFGVLICSELTNVKYATELRGKVDALIVPSWNKDIKTFSTLIQARAHDIHAYIVYCNNSTYGYTQMYCPAKEDFNRQVATIKSTLHDSYIIGEIDVKKLRRFQSNHLSPNKGYKPVGDGFEMDEERWIQP